MSKKVLAVALAAAFAVPAHAQAQGDEEPTVVVTATRFAGERLDYPVGVSVISRSQIERSPANNVADLLASHAGVQVRDNSGSRDKQIDLRGFGITGDQNTLILLDGQRLTENDFTPAHLSAIPLEIIERIEIIRGGGAVQYGAGATGGTINIVTRSPQAGVRSASVEAGAGSYDTRELNARANIAGERLGLSVAANAFDSDNYRRNNAARERNLAADLRYAGDAGNASLKLLADRQDLRLPGARTEAQLTSDPRGATFPDDFSNSRGEHALLSLSRRLAWGEAAVDVGRRERRIDSGSFVGLAFQTLGKARTESWSLSPRLAVDLPVAGLSNRLVAGVDLVEWDARVQRVGAFFSADNEAEQRSRGLYVLDNLRLTEATRISAGVRWQRTRDRLAQLPAPAQEITRSLTAHELALRHAFTPGVAAIAKLGRSFRFATIDDNAFTASGALLEPQTSRDAEIGLEFNRPGAALRLSAYQMRLRNEIRFDPSAGFFGANTNLEPTRRRGVEIDARWQATRELGFNASVNALRARFDAGAFAGNEVPLVPRLTAALGLHWRPLPAATLALAWRYVGEQRYDGDEANAFRKMPAYDILDARLSYAVADWTLSALASNLLNSRYYTYAFAAGGSFTAYPQPERSLMLRAEYRFR